ncbi:MAG: cytochrome c biogenesis protein CcdA [Thermodesulfobacteriota bacterium]
MKSPHAVKRHPILSPGAARIALLLVSLVLAHAGHAQEPGPAAEIPAVPVTLETSLYALPPDAGGGFLAVLLFTPAQGWHAYSHVPGDTGEPASADLRLEPPGTPLAAAFPEGRLKPDTFEPEKTARVHEAPTRVFVALPAAIPPQARLAGTLRLFLCSKSSCWPAALPVDLDVAAPAARDLPRADAQPWWPEYGAALETTARVAAMTPPGIPEAAPEPAATPEGDVTFSPRSFTPGLEVAGLLKASILAFLAGFILNFMPCVLPVVSLKLSSLLAVCGHGEAVSRHRTLREHNLFFALGILAYFLGLSLLLWFAGLAWGQIFQSTALTLALTVVLFALTMSLFGVFHLPVIDLKVPEKATGNSRNGAFVTGVLATLLATPCSGPFLGGVLAWTLLQPLFTVMAVFTCLGLGMALPYLMLAAWPRLVRLMPRPGGWMVSLEQGMGFLLAASCIYFLTILPQEKLVAALFALWTTALAAWIWGRFTNLSQSRLHRTVVRGLAALMVVAVTAFAAADRPAPSVTWMPYSQAGFESRLGRENLVLTFTADWCPTCKVLERTVLGPGTIGPLKKRYGLTLMRVDMTGQSPQAMALLASLGSRSIPLTALFPAGDDSRAPLVLRDLYTTSGLEQAMENAFGPGKGNPSPMP